MKRAALALIRWYQRQVSTRMAPSCRFLPTCSQYTYEAIERFGLLRGGAMGLWRILRCNPFSKGGLDPVPHIHSHHKSADRQRTEEEK